MAGAGSNIGSVGVNTTKGIGGFGNYPMTPAENKIFHPSSIIAVVEVKAGSATVTGKQAVVNSKSNNETPAWAARVLGIGVHIVNLKQVTIVASAGVSDDTVAHYGND